MDLLISVNSAINGIVWGPPMLVLLVGCGILLTIRTRGAQFTHFGYAMKNTVGKIFQKSNAGDGEMTPFQ
ncbi:MAG: sodium:alanine symporter family protein, partial [Ruminiclostridium sp.]|nr:sodium:alanine symporter family protein [Ruminiclostridium sp.]